VKATLATLALLSVLPAWSCCPAVAQAASPVMGAHPASPASSGVILIGERFGRPPPPPAGYSARPVTPDTTANAIAADLKARFEKATGASGSLLTKHAARTSGWGWAADHFDAIDLGKRGAISFDDILAYVEKTSKVALPRR
jgi:hypothetical protein